MSSTGVAAIIVRGFSRIGAGVVLFMGVYFIIVGVDSVWLLFGVGVVLFWRVEWCVML